MRAPARLLALLLALFASPAFAQVTVAFHSFNGSMLVGRYPHTFIVLERNARRRHTGQRELRLHRQEREPGGARRAGRARDPDREAEVPHHRPTAISRCRSATRQYRRIKAEVAKWRDEPGKAYRLDEHNCIHFVGRMAEIAGLKVDYPKALIRKPKAWLNHVAALNPAARRQGDQAVKRRSAPRADAVEGPG